MCERRSGSVIWSSHPHHPSQAAHKAASRASIEAQDRLRQLEGELRRLQAAQGACWVLGTACSG